jgi:hypothetical protein
MTHNRCSTPFLGRFYTKGNPQSGKGKILDSASVTSAILSSGYVSAVPLYPNEMVEFFPLAIVMSQTASFLPLIRRARAEDFSKTDVPRCFSEDEQIQSEYESEMLKLDGAIETWQKQLEESRKPLEKLKQEHAAIQQEVDLQESETQKAPTILNEMKLTAKQHALQQHAKLIEQAEVLFQGAASKINAHLQQLLIAKENRRLIERQKQVQLDHQQLTNAQPSETDQAHAQALLELSENALREVSAAQQKRTLSFY